MHRPDAKAEAVDTPRPPSRPLFPPRWALRAASAVGAALVALLLVEVGVLAGVPLLAVTALTALAVPTSRELSRRILILGCLFLGWAPFLWWWDLPLGHAGRVGLILASLVGGLSGWVLLAPGGRRRACSLLPRVRGVDLVAAIGGLVALWAYLPNLRVPSPEVALSRFLRAWDNSAHFNITEMIREHGALISRIPEGPLGEWSYADYPQGFHAAAATVMEGLAGVGLAEPGAELVTYARASTLVVVLALITVVAGLCSLPSLRRRPLLALPLVMFVVATFVLGPGGMALHNGFPNFFVASALVACVPLLVIQLARPGAPALLAALGGAVVGIAHNWSFLLTMAAMGAVAMVFPLRRARWPSDRRGWLVPGTIALATVAGVGAAWLMLRDQPELSSILVLVGPVTPVPVNGLVFTVGAAIAACAALAARRGQDSAPCGDASVRTAWVALLPLAGAVVAVLVAYFQVREVGDAGYYFWKYAIALQLLAAVVLAAAVPVLLRERRRYGVMARVTGITASGLAAAVAFQIYGFPVTLPTSLGASLAPGGAARADFVALADGPIPDAVTTLAAARAHATGPAVPIVLLPFPSEPFYPADGSVPPMMLSQWFNALTGRWTEPANALLDPAIPDDQSIGSAARAARRVFAADADAVVVVGPHFVDGVRDAVAGDGWSDRVVSW